MKKNIILCGIVSVCAIVGLVFSAMFCFRSGDFTKGWKALAKSIQRSSEEMDRNGGTEFAKELSTRTLQHEKYAQMDRSLGKLQGQSRDYIKSRDILAQTASSIAVKAGAGKYENATIVSAVDKSTAVDEMSREVSAVFENRDRSYSSAANLAKSLGYTVNTGKLIRGEEEALAPFEQALSSFSTRRETYEKCLKSIAVNIGVQSYDLSENAYKDSSKKLVASLSKFQAAHEKLAKEVDQARAENQKLSAQCEEQEKQLQDLQAALTERDRQIAGFKEALNEAEPVQESQAPWTAGSQEARGALVANVVRVDKKYGLVTVNIGSATTVSQKIAGSKEPNVVNVGLEVGNEVVIVRGDIASSPEYLTTLKLEKVDAGESVGRIPAGCGSIRVGDKVILRPAQNTAVK